MAALDDESIVDPKSRPLWPQGKGPLPPNPLPGNSTLPFWRTELHILDSHRSTPELPQSCDVLIIRAGYSGASTAYHLCESYGDATLPAIVIFGGTTGLLWCYCTEWRYPRHAALYGDEVACEIANFQLRHVLAVKDLVDKENIDCDFQLTRACDAMLDQEDADRVSASFFKIRGSGATCIREVQYTGGKYAEQISGVTGAKCCFTFPAAHLWPYKLVMHLIANVVSKGVNLQTHTPVTGVSDSPGPDGFWAVSTPRGVLRAKKIIFATNAYTPYIAPQYTNRIVPCRGRCSRITCPAGKAPHLPNTYSIRFGPGNSDYFIARADGSVVVGGAKPYVFPHKDLWYNVVDDSKIIEPARQWFDGYMQRNFRGWEDSDAYTDKVWSGVQGYTTDLTSHVGEVPGKPNQFILAGFNGHGMPEILLTSKAIAQMVKDGKSFEETGIPMAFKTTKARLDDDRNFLALR